jgi:2-polyprenyl-6-methoxyphenol hydroxylase-like FAD-dependent oxidoreductase
MPVDTAVLIVGAGPTGLMLANQLVHRGVRTVVIDRHAGPSLQTRALGVQARTLEVYAQLGLVQQALALGKPATGANLWAQGRQTARVPLGAAGRGITPYPYILILGQDDNERLLGERLREQGGAVTWNTELTGLVPQADHVAATLRQPDGTSRTLTAAWVAGCDGALSAVRTLNGIDFPGAPYEHVFFVADVTATGSMVPDEVNVYFWRAGFHLFFPMRGENHWRVVGIVPAALRDRTDLRFDDVVPSVRQEAGEGLVFAGCGWFSTYRIHHRAAERFRAGRCFLLGDAAHIHSPVGAQGMNTGLQDAYNLAWKLALVVQRRAGAALLDSYAAEREPVARRLLNTTDRAFRLVISDRWWAGLLRTRVLARVAALAMRRAAVQRAVFRVVSQTGIAYRDSALSQTAAELPRLAPQAGDRFPWLTLKLRAHGPPEDLFATLVDTHFHLLVFGQSAAADPAGAGEDLLRTWVVPPDRFNDAALRNAQIPPRSFYLLRPDGHVGLCGGRFDAAAVQRYLRERVALAEGSPSR